MIRPALLTLLLVLLGVSLTLPGTLERLGDTDVQRNAVLWGIPVAALLLSLIFHPRLSWPEREEAGPLGRRLSLLAGCAVAFLVDQSFLGLARLMDLATFTFGAQELDQTELPLTVAWTLPVCLVLGIWGWERALRGAVYTGWRRWFPRGIAIAASVIAGTALSLPAILPGGEVRDTAFVAASLVAVLCRELSLALVFTRGGGLLVAGLYRGIFHFTEGVLINDWYSLHFPAFNYVAGDETFYALRAGTALLALGVVVLVTRRGRGM